MIIETGFALFRFILLVLVGYFLAKGFSLFPNMNYGDSDIRVWKATFYILVAILFALIWVGVINYV